MVEVLVVIAIIGIVAGIAALDVRPLSNDALNAANEVAATVRLARARAVATTSSYRVVLESQSVLRVETRRTCGGSASWVEESALRRELASGVVVTDPSEAGQELVCFNSRGIGDADPIVRVRDARARESSVEVFAGGSVRVQ